MSRLFARRGAGRGIRDYVVRALLFGIPLAWFVFALEMTVLSVDRKASFLPTAPNPHPKHGSAKDFPGVGQEQPENGIQENTVDGLQKVDHKNVPAQAPLHRKQLQLKQRELQQNASPGHDSIRSRKLGEKVSSKEIQKVDREVVRNSKRRPKNWKERPKETDPERNRKEKLPRNHPAEPAGDNVVNHGDVAWPPVRFDPPKVGEHGEAVHVNMKGLQWQERAQYDLGYKTHNFNQFASDLISVQRTVPDFRHDECSIQEYNSSSMQQASIIMCFYNEAWSTLLRSIHSVLDRSPPHLLKELILVDDFSDLEHLKSDLDNYLSDFPKVKILRMPERVGLVRARLHGVDEAQGPIVIFLDSHIECGDGWMEPLVSVVSRNDTVAVTPIIDIIDKDTMAVVQAVESVGVVDLKHMTFIWSRLTPRIQASRASPAHPFLSPTMAGGLFAINKNFFLRLGTWDPGLVLWGGENLELSFKLWMCGGAILIHPCSRVSHIFRDKSPYLKANVDRVVKGNAARVAEVWLDDYKHYFFGGEQYDAGVYGDVGERKQLRHDLKCRSFQWYIENVYPELFIDGTGKYNSHIMSSTGLCLRFQDEERRILILHEDCTSSEVWQTTRTDEVRNGPSCLEQDQGHVFAGPCDSQQQNQAFQVIQHGPEVTMVHGSTGLCVTAIETGVMGTVQLAPCIYGDRRQLWTFQKNPAAL